MSGIKEPIESYETDKDGGTYHVTEYGPEDEFLLAQGWEAPNYTQVPNQLLGHWNDAGDYILGQMTDMGEAELKVALVLCRLTFGFHRDGAAASISWLEKATGMSRQGVLNGIGALIDRGLFIKGKAKDGRNLWVKVLGGSQRGRPEVVNVVDQTSQRGRPNKESIKKVNKVPAPKAARVVPKPPVKELEYVDDEDIFEDDNSYSAKRPGWQVPDTPEQKQFLNVCGAKWFESKQKRKVKAIVKALTAGDTAGTDVYYRCMEYLEDKQELVDVPPLMPRDWYDKREAQAREHRWNRWGFINALLNRDMLYEHCQVKQRELDRLPPATRFRDVEPLPDEPDAKPPTETPEWLIELRKKKNEMLLGKKPKTQEV